MPEQSTEVEAFDEVIDRSGLSTIKWEMEIEHRNNPSILSFGTADMDFKSPAPVRDALRKIVDAGHFGYPHKPRSYYDALIGYFDRHFAWPIHASWIGSHVGIYASMEPLIAELTQPGDEILYQTPVHKVFKEVIDAADRKPVALQLLKTRRQYEMDFDGLERALTSKTKMLLLCNPHNPVGRAWSREELERLSQICLKNNIVVLSDEVYCGLLYNGTRFTPYASVSQAASLNSVTLTSASKSFNLTGLKHSQIITENTGFMEAYNKGLKRGNLQYGGSTFGQVAAEVAYRDCDDWSRNLMTYIEGNFDLLAAFLAERMPGVTTMKPEATYVAWLDFSSYGLSQEELRHRIEDQANIVVTFGKPMGPGGENHVRINLGTQRSFINVGLERMRQAFAP